MALSKTEAGELLRKRREERGFTQDQVCEQVGIPTITQLSEYENGKVNVARSKYLPDLARVLGLTEGEVRSINPSAVFDAPPPPPRSPGFDLTPPYQPRLIAHAGMIGAGLSPLSYAAEHMEKRWMPYHPVLEGYRDEDLITLDVAGDSMVCDEVRLTVPEGSTVYLHTRLEPQPGDIVAVWLERENMGVLKLWKPDDGHIVLKSYNEHHRPIVLSESDAAQIQGVYLAHLSGGRRAHNVKAKMRR